MEIIAIILSGITAFASVGGGLVDKTVETAFVSQLDHVEQIQVRTDNAPVHQIINGKIDKVRIAGRGLWVTKDFRIDTMEIETDPIAVDLKAIQQDGASPQASSLKQPIQAGIKLKIGEADINNFLKSPDAIARLQKMTTSTLGGAAAGSLKKDYQIVNPQIRFVGDNRLGMKAELQDASGEKLAVDLESGVSVTGGRKFELVNPTAKVGDTAVPPFLLAGLTAGLTERLNVDILEPFGVTARILQFKVIPGQLELATFVRLSGNKTPQVQGQ